MTNDNVLTFRRYQETDEARVRELTIDSFNGVSIDQNFDAFKLESFAAVGAAEVGE